MKYVMLMLAVMFAGCSTVSKWEPTMNTMEHKNAQNQEKDINECRVLANNAAGWVTEGAEGAIVSAAGGAAEGAVIGALISGAGGAGVAAAAGAPIGAIAGLWYSEYEANLTFKRAFSNCLFQRGHYPLN